MTLINPGQVAEHSLAHLYGAARLDVYFFKPTFKLIDKIRDGAVMVKRYSHPTAPCDRLMEHDATGDNVKAPLGEYRARLDPVAFLHTIREPFRTREACGPWWWRPPPKSVRRQTVQVAAGSLPNCTVCRARVKRAYPGGESEGSAALANP